MAASTEARHEKAEGLDGLPPAEILSVLLDGQLGAVESVRKPFPRSNASGAPDRLTGSPRRPPDLLRRRQLGPDGHGRWPGTSRHLRHPARTRSSILLAGGAASLADLAGGYEDDDRTCARRMSKHCRSPRATAWSACPPPARHPMRWPQPTEARQARAKRRSSASPTIPARRCSTIADVADPAADAAGSRLPARRAWGRARRRRSRFNMLSTLTAVHLGHVHDGYMVNLRADNTKLRDRARRIVADYLRSRRRPRRAAARRGRRLGQDRGPAGRRCRRHPVGGRSCSKTAKQNLRSALKKA